MDIKTNPAASRVSDLRKPEPPHHSDERGREPVEDTARQNTRETAPPAAAPGPESRFFAVDESREITSPDSREQARRMRERVRQAYREQESRETRRAAQEQQAQNVREEEGARRNEARQPIDLIA